MDRIKIFPWVFWGGCLLLLAISIFISMFIMGCNTPYPEADIPDSFIITHTNREQNDWRRKAYIIKIFKIQTVKDWRHNKRDERIY